MESYLTRQDTSEVHYLYTHNTETIFSFSFVFLCGCIVVPNSAPVAQPQQPAKPAPQNRRPEELDALAAQLNDLGAPSNPPGVEDDDSDEDSAAPPASDGTLLASEPPKPL